MSIPYAYNRYHADREKRRISPSGREGSDQEPLLTRGLTRRAGTRSLLLAVLCQRFARYFLVVEVKSFAADDLIVLVTLTGDQNQIISAGLLNCVMNRFAAIGNFLVRLSGFHNTGFRVLQNPARILSARVV